MWGTGTSSQIESTENLVGKKLVWAWTLVFDDEKDSASDQ